MRYSNTIEQPYSLAPNCRSNPTIFDLLFCRVFGWWIFFCGVFKKYVKNILDFTVNFQFLDCYRVIFRLLHCYQNLRLHNHHYPLGLLLRLLSPLNSRLRSIPSLASFPILPSLSSFSSFSTHSSLPSFPHLPTPSHPNPSNILNPPLLLHFLHS